MNSLAGYVNWDISDLGVLPHRNESTRIFCFDVLFCCLVYFFFFSCLHSTDKKTKKISVEITEFMPRCYLLNPPSEQTV